MTRRPARVLGRTGRQAEWVALACLHNGVFTRVRFQMTGLRVMPRLECENDAGGRFTDDPGRDSQRHGSRFLCGCCGYAWLCPVGAANRAAPTGTGATPQAEGLVRARGQVCFHTPPPALLGSLPVQESLAGRQTRRPYLRPWANEVAVRASIAVLRAGHESRPSAGAVLVTPAWSLALHSNPFAATQTALMRVRREEPTK